MKSLNFYVFLYLCILFVTVNCLDPLWLQQSGATSTGNVGNRMVQDSHGNIYVTGSFRGTVHFGDKELSSAGQTDIFVVKYNSTGYCLWAKRAGSNLADEVGRGIALDKDENVLVTGEFRGTGHFGDVQISSKGFRDLFIAKYNSSDGDVFWATGCGGSGQDYGTVIQADSKGDVYVSGYFQQTAFFGDFNATSEGSGDLYLTKLHGSNGTVIWLRTAHGESLIQPQDMKIDIQDNLYMTGSFLRTFIFDDISITSQCSFICHSDVFVAKFDTKEEKWNWVQRAGGTSGDVGRGIIVDPQGQVFVSGYFASTARFGTYSTPDAEIVSAGGWDIFFAKYNPSNGVCLWAKRAGSSQNDAAYAMSMDGESSIYLAGIIRDAATFDKFTIVSAGLADAFVAKYNIEGEIQWVSHVASGPGNNHAFDIIANSSDHLYVTGNFREDARFGNITLSSVATEDIYISKFNVTMGDIFSCFGFEYYNSSACNGRGICESPDSCVCSTGYHGQECKNFTCYDVEHWDPSVCSGRGTCVAANNCNCPSGYLGNQCHLFYCGSHLNTNPNVCSGHGTCIAPGTCNCTAPFNGTNCADYQCFGRYPTSSLVCFGHGSCVGPNNCSCNTGYGGDNCDQYHCFGVHRSDSNVCSGHGTCTRIDTCSCSAGYMGTHCMNVSCFGVLKDSESACSGHGTCKGPNQCECNHPYTGSNCNSFACYGIDRQSSSVCSGHGVCHQPDHCVCNSGYSGNACQNHTCFGISSSNSSVCSGHGTCQAVDNCNCETGFGGSQCSNFTCYGESNDSPDACNGRGMCEGPNQCRCNQGYTGTQCQTRSRFSSAHSIHGTNILMSAFTRGLIPVLVVLFFVLFFNR